MTTPPVDPGPRRAVRPATLAAGYWADQTALLAGLLLTLITLCLAAIALMLLFEPFGAHPSSVVVAAVAGLLFTLAYGLNRRGRHRAAALLTVSITAAALWFSMLALATLPENEPIVLPYLVVPLLLAGLLLPFWPTLAIAAGNVVVALLHPTLTTSAPSLAFNTFTFLVIITTLVAAMARLRERRVAELERSSRELAESVAQFQNAFEHASIGMALVSPAGAWLRVNRSLCALLGYTEAEMLGLTFQAITHPNDLNTDLEHVRRLLAGEIHSYQMDKRYFARDGRLVWVTLNVSLVRSADGSPLHFVSQIQDISERKAAEEALRASEARFRTLSNASPVGIFETDADGHDTYHNERWLVMTGLTADASQGEGWLRAIHPDDRAAVAAEWDRCVREREPYSIEYRYFDREGNLRWGHSSAAPVFAPNGEVSGFVGTVADISERKSSEAALQAANERMAGWVQALEAHSRDIGLLNELSNLLQSCFTAEEAYDILRQLGQQLFPGQAGQLGMINASRNLIETVVAWGPEAADDAEARLVYSPEDCWALRRGRLHAYEAGPGAVRCTHLGQAATAGSLCLPMLAHGEMLGLLHLRAAAGRLPLSEARRGFAQTVADAVSLALANLKLRERLRDQSIRDVLTGLFNRRYLEETLNRELSRAERDGTPVGVLMLDIDHFKRFNDSFGHAAGDEVLRALGRLLGQHVRVEDIPCRYGGEEFTLVLPGCSLAAACERAAQLRQQVRELQITHAGQALGGLTVSIGVAALPQHGLRDQDLLRAADNALYQAKQAGRDRVMVAPLPEGEAV